MTTSATDTTDTTETTDYVSDREFGEFPISEEVLRGIQDLGYVTATPVQSRTIEPALAGRDMLVRAKTGTGKTAAFSVPLVERVPEGVREPRAIVLAPTRELAQQIAEECAGIARHRDVSVAVLVGGVAIGPQEKALADGAEIIIGTPGRILDHIRRKNLRASTVDLVCLDEADEMLSMGFFEDVSKILDATSADRQVLLFSATISPETERLAARYLNDPDEIILSTDVDQVEGIEHVLYETSPSFHKVRSLLYLLDLEDPTSAIIFCNTREDAATVAAFLDRQGLDAQLLSGELPQGQRNKVMAKVKRGDVRFLVATDVASRGIDISDLSHVINYSLPFDPAVYMHRIGRTGRIGKKGTAISLVGGPDLATRNTLVSKFNIDFNVKELPDAETCVRMRVERQAEQIRSAMSTMVFEAYLPTVRALKEHPDGDALLAAALRAFFAWDRSRKAEMSGVVEPTESEDTYESRPRKERRRGDRKEPRERKGRDRKDKDRKKKAPRAERSDLGDDLDALLVEGAASEPAPKPKKRRRRRKKDDDAPGTEAKGGASTDDLDALLTVE